MTSLWSCTNIVAHHVAHAACCSSSDTLYQPGLRRTRRAEMTTTTAVAGILGGLFTSDVTLQSWLNGGWRAA